MSDPLSPKVEEEFKSATSKDFNGTLHVENEAKLKMDFPFDLNNLFNMNYSFDILKQAIEFMAK